MQTILLSSLIIIHTLAAYCAIRTSIQKSLQGADTAIRLVRLWRTKKSKEEGIESFGPKWIEYEAFMQAEPQVDLKCNELTQVVCEFMHASDREDTVNKISEQVLTNIWEFKSKKESEVERNLELNRVQFSFFKELMVVGNYRVNLSLLKHELTQQNLIRICRSPPGEIPCRLVEPGQQTRLDF